MISRLLGFFRGHNASKDVAKERLRLVLMHDRAAVRPELLETLRNEIIEAISRYVEIDRAGIQVDLYRDGQEIALTANIPVRGLRRSGGIG